MSNSKWWLVCYDVRDAEASPAGGEDPGRHRAAHAILGLPLLDERDGDATAALGV